MVDRRPLKRSAWKKTCCGVCGSKVSEPLGKREYIWPTRHFRYEMIMNDALCLECGFVYEENVPDENFLNSYYTDSFSIDSVTADIRPDYDPAKRLDLMSRFLKRGAFILEAGANRGDFCQLLNERGFKAQGVDPLDAGQDRGIKSGFLSGDSNTEKGFDAVVSYYVLEHIADPKAWLSNLRSSLNDGGYLILEVPDFEAFPSESLNHEHLQHFTKSLLARCVGSCGFEVLETSAGSPSRYFGFCLVAKKTDNMRAHPAQSGLSDDASKNRSIYRQAMRLKQIEEEKNEAFALYLASAAGRDGVTVFFWGANEIATSIGSKFSSMTGINPRILDNSAGKNGMPHDGFLYPIAAPAFDHGDQTPKIFVLCSPSYNSQIAEQIKTLGISNALLIDAVKWRSTAAAEK